MGLALKGKTNERRPIVRQRNMKLKYVKNNIIPGSRWIEEMGEGVRMHKLATIK